MREDRLSDPRIERPADDTSQRDSRDAEDRAASIPVIRPSHGRGLRRVRRAVLLILLALAGLVLYLQVVGLPRPLVRAIESRLLEAGLPVRIGWIGWDARRGPALRNVTVYEDTRRSKPFCRIAALSLLLDPFGWLKGERLFRGVSFSGLEKRLSFSSCDGSRKSELLLSDGKGAVIVGGDYLALSGVSLRTGGLLVRLDGRFGLPPARPPEEAKGPSEVLAGVEEKLRCSPRWVLDLVDGLRQVTSGGCVECSLRFTVPAGDPVRGRAVLRLRGENIQRYEACIGRISMDAYLRDGTVDLASLQIRTGERSLVAAGKYDLRRNVVSLSASNSLPLSFWSCFIPGVWAAGAEQAGLALRGDMWWLLEAGPSDPAHLFTNFAAVISLARTELRGVWLEKAMIGLQGRGKEVTVDPLRLLVGNDRPGRIEAAIRMHAESGEYEGWFRAKVDPHTVMGWAGPGGADFIRRFQFDSVPLATGRFWGALQNPKAFGLQGKGIGSNFTYCGQEVLVARSGFEFTNDYLRLEPFLIRRREGELRGWLGFDFVNQRIAMDVCSGIHPQAAAQMVGPGFARLLERFRFGGPVSVCMSGVVAYGATPRGTDLQGKVFCNRVQYGRLSAERVSFDLAAQDDRLFFTNLRARAYTGSAWGAVQITNLVPGKIPLFSGELHAREVDVDRLTEEMFGRRQEKLAGKLWLDLEISGPVASNVLDRMTGHGYLKIDDGYLFRIPVLLFLSEFLSRLDPRIGYATLADFKAHFRIHDGKIHTKDALLMGGLFSIHARGRYYFDQRLDFIVRVQLLKRGPLAKLANMVTFPLTKLFELHLGGRVSRPRWRPMNFPKELFLIFD